MWLCVIKGGSGFLKKGNVTAGKVIIVQKCGMLWAESLPIISESHQGQAMPVHSMKPAVGQATAGWFFAVLLCISTPSVLHVRPSGYV